MQVAKWGNSLTVRLPANLVAALGLKEGEEVELHLVGEREFEVSKKASPPELLARLRQLWGSLPSNFNFNRLEANGHASQDGESAQQKGALKASWRRATGRA